MDYDAIIIGSGFGGSVLACRIADTGKKILLLERGREWAPQDYPSASRTNWFWNPKNPVNEYGLFDIRVFPNMTILTGAGLGGGSHVYSGVHVRATNAVLQTWPGNISRSTLDPYYDKIEKMMRIMPLPKNQYPPRTQLVQDAAAALGVPNRFTPLGLAISFDNGFQIDPGANPEDLIPKAKDVPLNGLPQRYAQKTCVHLSDCNIGCPVRAKNTLDLNYLAYAQLTGNVDIRTRSLVRKITPLEGGYQVDFADISEADQPAFNSTAKKVFVCAGSVGSTELLLRCRDEYRSLPNVSPALGTKWGPNGDFHTPAVYFHRGIYPESGPVTTAAIDFRDAAPPATVPAFVQDVGLPSILSDLFSIHGNPFDEDSELMHALLHGLRALDSLGQLRDFTDWFAQSKDASDGTFFLRQNDDDYELQLNWNPAASTANFNGVMAIEKQLTEATGGHATPLWPFIKSLVASHPLGGCRMSASSNDGVVDPGCQVYNYPNLYICDGSIVPTPIMANPSHTIAALAERLADNLPAGPW